MSPGSLLPITTLADDNLHAAIANNSATSYLFGPCSLVLVSLLVFRVVNGVIWHPVPQVCAMRFQVSYVLDPNIVGLLQAGLIYSER